MNLEEENEPKLDGNINLATDEKQENSNNNKNNQNLDYFNNEK